MTAARATIADIREHTHHLRSLADAIDDASRDLTKHIEGDSSQANTIKQLRDDIDAANNSRGIALRVATEAIDFAARLIHKYATDDVVMLEWADNVKRWGEQLQDPL